MNTITLYHGSASKFEKFDFSKAGTITEDMSSTGGLGIWLTDSLKYARCYAANAGGQIVYEVEVEDRCIRRGQDTPEALEDFVEKFGITEARRLLMEEEQCWGFDSWTPYGTEFCIMEPELIKGIRIIEQ